MRRFAVAIALVAQLSGCYSMTYDSRELPDGAVSMSSPPEGVETRHFEAERRTTWTALGLWGLSKASLASLAHDGGQGQRIYNASLKTEMTATDALLTASSLAVLGGLGYWAFSMAQANGQTAIPWTVLLTPIFLTTRLSGDAAVEEVR